MRKKSLKQLLEDKMAAPTHAQWQATIASFKEKLAAVEQEKRTLMKLRKEAQQRKDLPKLAEETDQKILNVEQELKRLRHAKKAFESESQVVHNQNLKDKKDADRELEQVIRNRPNWLFCWISKRVNELNIRLDMRLYRQKGIGLPCKSKSTKSC